ncbi:amidohydrolase family protein [Paraburkholderia fungorum]|uniref:amidohydrolase family protein n=1 Tax=Paraburkholderia fungorum TaxID=134537 RepID=UPI0038BC7566
MPDIRFIFCHGNGVMLILLGRIAGFLDYPAVGQQRLDAMFPDGIRAEFSKLYFDCAQAYAPEIFDMLRKIVPKSQLLFGSDYSYIPIRHGVGQFGKLALPASTRTMILGGNAAALLPRWQA